MGKELDRVSYSFGMKLNTGNYQSSDFHISLTSDVNSDETAQQALDRVKKEVLAYAKKAYAAIRESETGLEQSSNERDVSTPVAPTNTPAVVKKPKDTKFIKQQIKSAFALLEAQKKITKEAFVKEYLNNSKVDQLEDSKALEVINKLKTNFKELAL